MTEELERQEVYFYHEKKSLKDSLLIDGLVSIQLEQQSASSNQILISCIQMTDKFGHPYLSPHNPLLERMFACRGTLQFLAPELLRHNLESVIKSFIFFKSHLQEYYNTKYSTIIQQWESTMDDTSKLLWNNCVDLARQRNWYQDMSTAEARARFVEQEYKYCQEFTIACALENFLRFVISKKQQMDYLNMLYYLAKPDDMPLEVFFDRSEKLCDYWDIMPHDDLPFQQKCLREIMPSVHRLALPTRKEIFNRIIWNNVDLGLIQAFLNDRGLATYDYCRTVDELKYMVDPEVTSSQRYDITLNRRPIVTLEDVVRFVRCNVDAKKSNSHKKQRRL